MRKIQIEAGENTPLVILDKENSKMEIRGYSFPDEAHVFYIDLVDWFKEYSKNPNDETQVVFDFKYVNSTSIKFINDILKKLDSVLETGKKVSVNWFYETDDEDIQQLGVTLQEFHKTPFTISPNAPFKERESRKLFD